MSFDVCRICLAGNATYLPSTQLIHIYEKITSNQWNKDQRPDKVCDMCRSLLRKCYKLSDISKKSEVIFAQFFAGGFEFSEETIPILNQRKLYGLSVSPMQIFDLDKIPDDVEEVERNEELHYEVKIEFEPEEDFIKDLALEQIDEIKQEDENVPNDSLNNKMIYDNSLNVKSRSHVIKESPNKTTEQELKDKTDRNSFDTKNGRLSENGGKNNSFTLRFNLSDGVMRRRSSFPFNLCNKSLNETSDIKHTDNCNESNDDNLELKTNNDLEYICEDCKKTFSKRHLLLQHMRKHERRYACEECPKTFRQWSHIDQHLRSHHKVKPYECDVCEKRFTQLSHLQQHRRIHTGETPYGCDLCDKKFKQASNLIQHKLKHTKESYSCELCSKKFTQLGNLEKHKKVIHNNERPFKCVHCDAGFGRKGNLMAHIKRKHGDGDI